jgi:hypothetical protein
MSTSVESAIAAPPRWSRRIQTAKKRAGRDPASHCSDKQFGAR